MSKAKYYLRCRIIPGMFSDEVVVEITVPKSEVKEGKIRVGVVQQGNVMYAALPTVYPENAIPVRKDDLVKA